MINQRKMIDVLLLLEAMFIQLGLLIMRSSLALGNGLRSFVFGRNGRRLLSYREIYARNILKYWQTDGRSWANRGIYIGRVGRYNSARSLRIGQG